MRSALLLTSALTLTIPSLGACGSRETSVLRTCAQCGVIRAIQTYQAWGPLTEPAIPGAITELSATSEFFQSHETHPAFNIRIKMDRGGARDVTVVSTDGLRVGDRVELLNERVNGI